MERRSIVGCVIPFARSWLASGIRAAHRRGARRVPEMGGGSKCVVEIGVAEGVSALALREGMAEEGTLYLIEPFHLSRIRAFNFLKRMARRTVNGNSHGKVVWIEKFSQDAARGWRESIDLILIDGDHAEAAVERDWRDWSGFVKPGGIAIFHDARVFEGGWTTPGYRPVKFVDRVLGAAGRRSGRLSRRFIRLLSSSEPHNPPAGYKGDSEIA
jgi:predicted O-methyltransferase YrrM